MRKMKLWVVVTLIFTLIGGVVFKIGVSANGEVEHLSNQEYKDDLVANGTAKKYDIAPAATPAVEKEKPLEGKEVDVKKFDRLLPVIASLSGHIHTRNSGYHAYKSSFYETSLNGILKYCEQDKFVEYTEDDNNYYLDSKNMRALSDTAYWGGDYTTLQELGDGGAAYYDEEKRLYVVTKYDVDMGYSVKLNKATARECEHGMNYTLTGELYKDGEKIDNINVDILRNESDIDNMPYAVHWLWMDNYGIEVY